MRTSALFPLAAVLSACLSSFPAFAQARGSTGPGMPVLVGEEDSIDFSTKASEANARETALRDAVQDQQRRGAKQDRAVAALPADLIAGATVYDQKGVEIGAIQSVRGETAIVSTDGKVVGIPVDAFGKNRKGLLLAMTKAQFDRLVAKAQ